MEKLKFDLSKKGGRFKILNATNGGPWHRGDAIDQVLSNFEDYKAARIPYSRNHDSGIYPIYGGPYSHDIANIFPDFNADENDPGSYDFACTDQDILVTLNAGTQTFFRLGQTIEHQVKKHGTVPPKDFKKWSVICEHIIRHYNEGWANGFYLNMEYWEIWNEPDLDDDDCTDKRTWGGTKKQFFDLYETAAKHLKSCFPNLKIGGPALAYRLGWAEDFLKEMQKREVPVDFFSWHIYCVEPKQMVDTSDKIRALLDQYGYRETESILDEWNYVANWQEYFVESLKIIHGIKSAAFVMACISAAQRSSIDMLMYYDTIPNVFNGVFDFYTCEKLKSYYPLYWYGMFYDMMFEVRSENDMENIYSLCGVGENEKTLSVITYYTDKTDASERSFSVDFGRKGLYQVYLLDEKHNGELIDTTEELNFTLEPNTSILIKEI